MEVGLFRDAEASLPPAEAAGSHRHQPTRFRSYLLLLWHRLRRDGWE